MSVYQLNKLLFDLRESEKIRRLVQDSTGSLGYTLSAEELGALRAEDVTRLYELGANPYLIRFTYRHKFRF